MTAPTASILALPTVPSALDRYYLNAVETG